MTIRIDANGKIFTDIVRKDEVPVTIQTLTHRLHGNIYLRPEQRIKDELNESRDTFIAVTDARVFAADGSELYHSDFLTVNKHHIVWIRPDPEDDSAATTAPAQG